MSVKEQRVTLRRRGAVPTQDEAELVRTPPLQATGRSNLEGVTPLRTAIESPVFRSVPFGSPDECHQRVPKSRASEYVDGMNGRRDLRISDVIHKAFVEINEEETEAAAATGINIMALGAFSQPPFRADHPFLFLIRDTRNGSILFLGRINDPTKETGSEDKTGNRPHRLMPPPKDD